MLRTGICLILGLLMLTGSTGSEAGPRVGDKFGSWTFLCKAYGPGETKCALVQELRLKKNGRSGKHLLAVNLGYIGSANVLALSLRTPLNAYLPAGVSINIDSGKRKKVPYRQCKTTGCVGMLKVSGKLRDELRRGLKMNVIYTLIMKKGVVKVPVSVSLRGVSAGLQALDGDSISPSDNDGGITETLSPVF